MDYREKLAAAQQQLSHNDPKLATLIARHGPCELTPHTDYFRALLRSIVGQQLSVKAAATIYSRLLDLFDGNVPTPEQLLQINPENLRAVGLSSRKVEYVRDLSQHIIDGRLDLKHVSSLPNDELIAELIDVKGIGTWSAHMFLIFCLGRLDILPVGDLGIIAAMANIYELPARPSPTEMLALALKNKWTGYESVASWYLWRSLDNTPVVPKH